MSVTRKLKLRSRSKAVSLRAFGEDRSLITERAEHFGYEIAATWQLADHDCTTRRLGRPEMHLLSPF
jgi:hypothetical protein